MHRDRAADIIAVVVTAIWAASMVADAVSVSYAPPLLIHFSMLTTVGLIMGFKYSKHKEL